MELKYELYAIVEHTGFSSTSGHYFSYIRSSPDTWHRLDDSKVIISVYRAEAAFSFYFLSLGLHYYGFELVFDCIRSQIAI